MAGNRNSVVCATIVLKLLPKTDAASTFRPPAPAVFCRKSLNRAAYFSCGNSTTPRGLITNDDFLAGSDLRRARRNTAE
jgi:hypothetical protein